MLIEDRREDNACNIAREIGDLEHHALQIWEQKDPCLLPLSKLSTANEWPDFLQIVSHYLVTATYSLGGTGSLVKTKGKTIDMECLDVALLRKLTGNVLTLFKKTKSMLLLALEMSGRYVQSFVWCCDASRKAIHKTLNHVLACLGCVGVYTVILGACAELVFDANLRMNISKNAPKDIVLFEKKKLCFVSRSRRQNYWKTQDGYIRRVNYLSTPLYITYFSLCQRLDEDWLW